MLYLYLKALHLLFIIAWMAGIFYLPRIFVHYVEGKAAGEDVRRLKIMARRLYHFTSMVAVFALATGIGLAMSFGMPGWLHAKLAMVVLLIAYHISTRVYMKRMQRDEALPSAKVLRWYNEIPLVILAAILYFVVLKPF
ncbi:MAG TPA: CopD family protein [Steroidobacteraceae bacterium]|nr:CopD family protein [Steroidobacteraceae bacterium]